MRYPVAKSKEEYIEKWYIAQGFGEETNYGFHEGCDFNLKSGGNSDLGQPIYAISGWQLSYYHIGTHPSTGFGRHFVYKIEGDFGTRWVHCAHNQDVLKTGGDMGAEGEQLSTLGNTGTEYAHLHFSIFKVDPKSLPNGIDTIARTKDQLNQWWEDPIIFIEKWISPPKNWEKIATELEKEISEKNTHIANLQGQVNQLIKQKDELSKSLGEANSQLSIISKELDAKNQALINELESQHDFADRATKAEDERDIIKNQFSSFLWEVEDGLKLSSNNSSIDERISAVKMAIESFFPSGSLDILQKIEMIVEKYES